MKYQITYDEAEVINKKIIVEGSDISEALCIFLLKHPTCKEFGIIEIIEEEEE